MPGGRYVMNQTGLLKPKTSGGISGSTASPELHDREWATYFYTQRVCKSEHPPTCEQAVPHLNKHKRPPPRRRGRSRVRGQSPENQTAHAQAKGAGVWSTGRQLYKHSTSITSASTPNKPPLLHAIRNGRNSKESGRNLSGGQNLLFLDPRTFP